MPLLSFTDEERDSLTALASALPPLARWLLVSSPPTRRKPGGPD
jgi:hypothetical protein